MSNDDTVTVHGASDDLIEIDGAIEEEFNYRNDEGGDLLAFNDGTLLRITYTRDAIWRITPIVTGTAALHWDHIAHEGDEDDYTDRVSLVSPSLAWVAHGVDHAVKKKGTPVVH